MAITLLPARPSDIRTFLAWRYEPPYDIYDITDDVDESIEYFLDPSVQCHVLVDDGELIGFCTFGPDGRIPGGSYDEDAIDIGLGMDPKRIGRGRGRDFVEAVADHAAALFPEVTQRVTIATWNDRALATWRGVGFLEVARFSVGDPIMGTRDFVILTSS
ncbi:MAG: GNAT family N-acetyltransferase [Actinomycetota bacterium]